MTVLLKCWLAAWNNQPWNRAAHLVSIWNIVEITNAISIATLRISLITANHFLCVINHFSKIMKRKILSLMKLWYPLFLHLIQSNLWVVYIHTKWLYCPLAEEKKHTVDQVDRCEILKALTYPYMYYIVAEAVLNGAHPSLNSFFFWLWLIWCKNVSKTWSRNVSVCLCRLLGTEVWMSQGATISSCSFANKTVIFF